MHRLQIVSIAAACLLAVPANAAIVVQAGDPGASESSLTPNSDAAALAFDAANPPSFIETFEDADADGFSFSAGTITSNPIGGGSSVFGFNTTDGGDFVLELYGEAPTFTFANPISSFGFYLSGVQLDNLSISFNDGSSQSFAINNYGSGVQFFGASNFANPISSFSLLNTNDIIGVDDLRFATAAVAPGVPEPSTWAMMLLGFGLVGGVMRSAKRRQKLRVSFA